MLWVVYSTMMHVGMRFGAHLKALQWSRCTLRLLHWTKRGVRERSLIYQPSPPPCAVYGRFCAKVQKSSLHSLMMALVSSGEHPFGCFWFQGSEWNGAGQGTRNLEGQGHLCLRFRCVTRTANDCADSCNVRAAACSLDLVYIARLYPMRCKGF